MPSRPVVEIGPGDGEVGFARDLIEPHAAPLSVMGHRVIEHQPAVAARTRRLESGQGKALITHQARRVAKVPAGLTRHPVAHRHVKPVGPAVPHVRRQQLDAPDGCRQDVGQHAGFMGEGGQPRVGHRAPPERALVDVAGHRQGTDHPLPRSALVHIGAHMGCQGGLFHQGQGQLIELGRIEVDHDRSWRVSRCHANHPRAAL